ncbi:hypothetical protein KM043_002194 [Ampulex compressa]|nr:hypothetical protein KM043_002194 [Ampulex compressa]
MTFSSRKSGRSKSLLESDLSRRAVVAGLGRITESNCRIKDANVRGVQKPWKGSQNQDHPFRVNYVRVEPGGLGDHYRGIVRIALPPAQGRTKVELDFEK